MGFSAPLLKVRSMPRGVKRSVVITVSRKDVPLAVTRNRIRRRIRAALAKTGSKPTHAVMIIGNARVAKAPFKELLEELNKTFRHHE